jgi:hypothetical protein
MDRRENVPLEGELNCWARGFDMPDVLLKVCETGKTGLLRFASAEAEKTLFIREGEIIFAKSSSLDDRLGEYLLLRGQISISDLARLATEVRPGRRLGTVLVENNILEAKDLVQAVIGQVRAIILSLFRWTEAWYGFNEQELPNEAITLNMPTVRLIIDGIQLIDSWRRIAQGVGDLSSVYKKVPGNEDSLRSLNLDAPILEVLAILSQPHSVESVCATSRLPDLDVCRHLWVFRCLGWIEQTDGAEDAASTTADAPELERSEEDSEGESSPVKEESVEVGEESQTEAESAPEVPSLPELVLDSPESASSSKEEEVRIEVEEDAAPSLADLQESGFEMAESEPAEPKESPEIALEMDCPAPPPQSTSKPEAPSTSLEGVVEAPVVAGTTMPSEAGPQDGAEPSVVEVVATPSEADPADAAEVPLIEGAPTPPETSPEDANLAPVIDGVVAETAAEENKKEDDSEETEKAPVAAADDMDFEGLGMVLGEEKDK